MNFSVVPGCKRTVSFRRWKYVCLRIENGFYTISDSEDRKHVKVSAKISEKKMKNSVDNSRQSAILYSCGVSTQKK